MMSERVKQLQEATEASINKKIRSAKRLAAIVMASTVALGGAWFVPAMENFGAEVGAAELGLVLGGSIGVARKRRKTHLDCRELVNEYHREQGSRAPYNDINAKSPEQVLHPPNRSPVFVPLLDELRTVGSNSALLIGASTVLDAFTAEGSENVGVGAVLVGYGVGYLGYRGFRVGQERMDQARDQYIAELA